MLSVAIDRQGFTVLGADHVLAPDEEGPVTIPCRGDCAEGYDYAELTRRLALVKDEHPDDQAVILVPSDDTPYEVVVGAMDATRADAQRELFPAVVIAGGVSGG